MSMIDPRRQSEPDMKIETRHVSETTATSEPESLIKMRNER
jgi:hypothetical protein